MHPQCYAQLHLDVLSAQMHFIAMDMISKLNQSP